LTNVKHVKRLVANEDGKALAVVVKMLLESDGGEEWIENALDKRLLFI
jgi:hypothetical protein